MNSTSGISAPQQVLAAQQSATAMQIQTAVQKKSLDAMKVQGAAVLELLQGAANLSKAVGKGGNFDANA
jgi:hypothetical protein